MQTETKNTSMNAFGIYLRLCFGDERNTTDHHGANLTEKEGRIKP